MSARHRERAQLARLHVRQRGRDGIDEERQVPAHQVDQRRRPVLGDPEFSEDDGGGLEQAHHVPAGPVEAHGICDAGRQIPFDRHREGLLLDAPLWENTFLGREEDASMTSGPFLVRSKMEADSRAVIERFGVRTPSEQVPAFALSGGNQQKLVVGREMSSHPRVLLAAHPTRGVDVGAQAAIWAELRAARDAGLAVAAEAEDSDIAGLVRAILSLP